MSTLSVPLPPDLEKVVKELSKKRKLNKAEIVRQAIRLLAEEDALATLLQSEKEITEGKLLSGDLRSLMKKIK